MHNAKALLALFCLASFCPAAGAADRITATVSLTNAAGTTNGQTLTVNGDIRTFTNNVVVPSIQVATNSTPDGSKTNLYKQIGLFGLSQIAIRDAGSTNFTLTGASGLAMSVSLSAGVGTVTYATQAVTAMIDVRVPVNGETPAVQTNIASGLVAGINLNASTNAFNETAPAMANLAGLSKAQTITGATILSNAGDIYYLGTISNAAAISGNLSAVSNGVWWAGFLSSPTLTNAINYGNAFSSPGTATGSEQFGAGAAATGQNSTAEGASSTAEADGSSAFGAFSHARGPLSTAIGDGAVVTAGSTNGVSVGNGSSVQAVGGVAVGQQANAVHTNSTAIGYHATTTASNQVVLGDAGNNVNTLVSGNISVGGNMQVTGNMTNIHAMGTNLFPSGSSISFGRYALSSLANGPNSISIGTNAWIEVSGPTAAFTITGIDAQPNSDGIEIWILNQTGQNMTIAHQSGLATAANRIVCLTGADKTVTGNSAACLKYSGASSRWIVHYFGQ